MAALKPVRSYVLDVMRAGGILTATPLGNGKFKYRLTVVGCDEPVARAVVQKLEKAGRITGQQVAGGKVEYKLVSKE